MRKKKVVLAYSGGLDTTYCALYLSKTLKYEVHALTVNTGGYSPREINLIAQKAKKLGVESYQCINSTKTYYDTCLKYLLFGNVLKNNTYPLSVSAERSIQAKVIAEYALKIEADAICHGSTGAGNDQVRFDIGFHVIAPDKEIITPIRDQQLSRKEEMDFLKKHGVKVNTEQSKYSINQGLWGTSVGGVETLTSGEYLPETAFPSQIQKTKTEKHTLFFEKGELTGIDDQKFDHPIEAIRQLEQLGAAFGIGRDIHVGDTLIGIKGRVGFEAAAAILAIKAHHLLEKHTLSKKQLQVKDQLSNSYGNWIHDALYLDPVMRDIECFLQNTQKRVTGKVFIRLYPYRFILEGIESPFDLMNNQFAQYGEMNNAWTAQDVRGFSKIMATALNIYYQTGQNAK